LLASEGRVVGGGDDVRVAAVRRFLALSLIELAGVVVDVINDARIGIRRRGGIPLPVIRIARRVACPADRLGLLLEEPEQTVVRRYVRMATVLLIHDNKLERSGIEMMLRSMGHEVVGVLTGRKECISA